jgi:hypothetical protein
LSGTRLIAHGLCSTRTLISPSILTNHVRRPTVSGAANRKFSNASGVAEEIASISVLKVQAESGNIIAQFNLGQAYLNGHHGLSKSTADAIFWIKR